MSNRPKASSEADAQMRPLLIQRVCEYLRKDDCLGCPAMERDIFYPEGYRPMCRELAVELIAVVRDALEVGPE